MEFFSGRPEEATTLLHCPSAPDPSFKASKAPFLTLRVANPSGAPLDLLLDANCPKKFHTELFRMGRRTSTSGLIQEELVFPPCCLDQALSFARWAGPEVQTPSNQNNSTRGSQNSAGFIT